MNPRADVRSARHAGREVGGHLKSDPESLSGKFSRTDGILKGDTATFRILQLDGIPKLAQTVGKYTASESDEVRNRGGTDGNDDEPLVVMKVDWFFPAILETFLLIFAVELDKIVLGRILFSKITDDLIGSHLVVGSSDFFAVEEKADDVRHGAFLICERDYDHLIGSRLDYRAARSYNLRLRL